MAVCKKDIQRGWGTVVLPVCVVVDAAHLLACLQQVQDPSRISTFLLDL